MAATKGLEACGCGWELPVDFTCSIPTELIDEDADLDEATVEMSLVCPRCGAEHVREDILIREQG